SLQATSPTAQARNSFAESVKISTCADFRIFGSPDAYCGTSFVLEPARNQTLTGVCIWADLESYSFTCAGDQAEALTCNLGGYIVFHRVGFVNDGAYSIGPGGRVRLLGLFCSAGLSVNHHLFDEELPAAWARAILKARDGELRVVIPAPLGEYVMKEGMEVSL
ncbi:hypothetical protein C7212DRAFT_184131, partial [Tuber magnatum]